MRIATFNVENLFERPVVMNQETWKDGAEVLSAYAEFNALIQEDVYTSQIKARLLRLLVKLGILSENKYGALRTVLNPKFSILRKNKGAFLTEPRDVKQSVEIVAPGRTSWVGWVELRKNPVNEVATRNTARVISDIHPDVIGIVEAESRKALKNFNQTFIGPAVNAAFDHVMLIQGNDPRGIDVGVMIRNDCKLLMIQSHVDDMDGQSRTIFSRDCPEYEIKMPSGKSFWLLVNHLKSQGYRGTRNSDDVRRDQAQRVREIYETLKQRGEKFIAVIGDFNDSPDRGPLDPLLKKGSDLKDVFDHPQFQNDGIPGTHGEGYAMSKFDYILLSPDLFSKVFAAGVFRKGVWDGRKKPKWEMYENMKGAEHAASDHALVWADINI